MLFWRVTEDEQNEKDDAHPQAGRRRDRPPPVHLRHAGEPRPPQPEHALPPAGDHQPARGVGARTRTRWPSCSAWTTSPRGCAATPRTCSCSPVRSRRGCGASRSRCATSCARRSPRPRTWTGWRSRSRRARSSTAPSVTDLTHLLAELTENAVRFSPPDTAVTIRGRRDPRGGRGQLLTVEDWGVGMDEADLAAANTLLADPPEVDLSVSKRLGFHVVSRLAARHGIRVALSPHARVGDHRVRRPARLAVRAQARTRRGAVAPAGRRTAHAGPPCRATAGSSGPHRGVHARRPRPRDRRRPPRRVPAPRPPLPEERTDRVPPEVAARASRSWSGCVGRTPAVPGAAGPGAGAEPSAPARVPRPAPASAGRVEPDRLRRPRTRRLGRHVDAATTGGRRPRPRRRRRRGPPAPAQARAAGPPRPRAAHRPPSRRPVRARSPAAAAEALSRYQASRAAARAAVDGRLRRRGDAARRHRRARPAGHAMTRGSRLDWLLVDFARETPGVRPAVVVSVDGLPLAASAGVDRRARRPARRGGVGPGQPGARRRRSCSRPATLTPDDPRDDRGLPLRDRRSAAAPPWRCTPSASATSGWSATR